MNYRNILLVIASIVVLIVISFIAYKQSVNKVAQPIAEQNSVLDVATELKLQEQVAPLITAGDMDACNQVQDDMYKKVCINNIALKKANDTKDISYCQYLDDKLITRESCERQITLQKSVEREDMSICSETKNETLQKQCENAYYFGLAQKKQNPSICDKDADSVRANQCWNIYHAQKLMMPSDNSTRQSVDCSLLRGKDEQKDCTAITSALNGANQQKIMEVCGTQTTQLFGMLCMMNMQNQL